MSQYTEEPKKHALLKMLRPNRIQRELRCLSITAQFNVQFLHLQRPQWSYNFLLTLINPFSTDPRYFKVPRLISKCHTIFHAYKYFRFFGGPCLPFLVTRHSKNHGNLRPIPSAMCDNNAAVLKSAQTSQGHSKCYWPTLVFQHVDDVEWLFDHLVHPCLSRFAMFSFHCAIFVQSA